MISRRHLLGLLTASAVPVRVSWAQGTEWSMVTEYPATSMSGEGLRLFAETVARESGGRIVVQPSFDASLKSADMPAAVRDGQIAAADAFAGGLGRLDPLFLLSSLPFLAATNDEARRLYAAARAAYVQRLAQEGQILLFATPWPPSGLTRLADNYARMTANGVTITKADAVASDLRALLARSAGDAIDAWKAQVGPERAGLLATVGK